MGDAGGAEDEGAVGDGVGQGGKFAGGGEDGCCTDGGAGLVPGGSPGLDDAEVVEAEVDHGAGGGTDVERVAGVDEDNGDAMGRDEVWLGHGAVVIIL